MFGDIPLSQSTPSDLGLLKRDRKLQKRYEAWAAEIEAEYGTLSESSDSLQKQVANSPQEIIS